METLDQSECEREPICHLGFIQPHGYLLAFDGDAEITHASENIGQSLSMAASDALGRSLGQVLGAEADSVLKQVAGGLESGQVHHQFRETKAERQSLWLHRSDAEYVLEWERLSESYGESESECKTLLASGVGQIGREPHIARQAQLAADFTARLTGYERVMVYRFHPDWSGEVIAEVRQSWAEPFLGLRYPASDIPPQARKLYMENLLRVIVDVYGTPVRILSPAGTARPLDLTHSQLRAVSGYHIQYLKNMRVGATATASLVVNGALWGMIACHHDRRKSVSLSQREGLSQIARTFSQAIEKASARARQISTERVKASEKKRQAAITDRAAVLPEMLFGSERLRNLLRCCGVGVWSAQKVLRTGDAPSAQKLAAYAAQLLSGNEDVVALDSRAQIVARLGVAPLNSSIAGLIGIIVSRTPALVLFGFRLEAIREITWGGDINQPVLRDEQTGALSPRRSFAQYKQNILGKAEAWTEEDLATAQTLLKGLRETVATAEQVAEVIEGGFRKIRLLATVEYPLQQSLLDALGNGISLLFRTDSGEPALRYANQALLDIAQDSTDEDANPPNAHELLAAIGLPTDLLTQCEFDARQVVIPTNREGLRHFLVERKLALEVRDEIGGVSLSALLFTDTTREERAREALQSAQDRAKHLSFLKSAFLANMSHEIRTPMNGILGMVQLLQTTRKDPEQQRYLDIIQRSGDLMMGLINDILDLSKIEAGHTEVEKVPFDLTAVVEGVADLLRPRAHEKSIGLYSVFLSPPPHWYLGDSFRLRQVILNIVGNAIKFTAAGQVTLSVRCEDMALESSSVVISIADSGVGIPEEELGQVFEKFHQADASSTRKHGGTGLGLAISRELVYLMGGTISLASKVGVGSTFTVALPLTRSSDPGQTRATEDLIAASTAQNNAAGVGRRILVAEDDLTNQIVIEEILKTQGFVVEIAPSGLKVLELLRAHSFDLILMDCHMPELDGYETSRMIRAAEQATGQHIPIVALTASALSDDRGRCINAGMDDYLSKPIQIETLWEVLRKWKCLPTQRSSSSGVTGSTERDLAEVG
jgi:light-regulated signal transduction histidine kinase (bacteriophytochrome)/CheY-like chemotaxis protein